MTKKQTAVKVRIKAYGKRAKTVYFATFEKADSDVSGSPVVWWVGKAVGKDGGATRHERIHVVDDSAIVSQTQVVMNHHYGEFEPVRS